MRIHRSKTSLAPAKAKEDPKRIVFYGKEYGLLPYHEQKILSRQKSAMSFLGASMMNHSVKISIIQLRTWERIIARNTFLMQTIYACVWDTSHGSRIS